MPAGRPTEYSPEVAREICDRLAAGEALRKICSAEAMPAPSTVCGWNLDDREGFSEQYRRARSMQAELLADELFSIADDGSNDTYEATEGEEKSTRTDHDVINRSRLRIDTRKWYLSKVLPKIYGDKVTNEHTGLDGGPLVFVVRDVGEE